MTSLQDQRELESRVLRAAMVRALWEMDAVSSDRIAAALSAVPRHLFAPGEPLERVYDVNATLAPKTDAGGAELSVVSAPHIQAFELGQAQIEPGMRVLEVGTGGYNAALIAELVGPGGSVTTVDIDADIVARARAYLGAAGYAQVRVLQVDAEHGVAEHAPYDRIIVTAGAWDIPPAWLDQLAADGRIVVPLRFGGITRMIAFDRGDTGLVSHSYRLAAFVPMQGDGASADELVPITGEVALRLDHQPAARFDVPALRKAVHSPRIERWSGAAFDLPDELELFLVTSAPDVPMLNVSQNLVDQGVFAASARRGVPVLVEGGSFAYRTKRANEQLGGFETGVFAHGPDAETVAARYIDLLRRWAKDYRRRGAAHISYLPNRAGGGEPAGWHATKRHGVVAVTWA